MTSQVTLKGGEVALVDEEDLPLIGDRRWYLGGGYALAWSRGRGDTVLMHRLIIGAKKGQRVDHINGDRLDNRRANLRICNASQNAANNPKPNRDNASGVRGVYWHEKKKRWRAAIMKDGRKVMLGSYVTIHEAARAYREARERLFGDFAPKADE